MTLLVEAQFALSVAAVLLLPSATIACGSFCRRRSKKDKRSAKAQGLAGSSGKETKADEVEKTQEETEPTQPVSPPTFSPVSSTEKHDRDT
uniref:Transmembrane protein n=1 Tax=Steinernema glaseri TaxID=37863 RepID=A0A1I8AIL6_9BILA